MVRPPAGKAPRTKKEAPLPKRLRNIKRLLAKESLPADVRIAQVIHPLLSSALTPTLTMSLTLTLDLTLLPCHFNILSGWSMVSAFFLA